MVRAWHWVTDGYRSSTSRRVGISRWPVMMGACVLHTTGKFTTFHRCGKNSLSVDISLRDTQRFWMDYLVNPYVNVYSREELLAWNSDNLNWFDVYKLGGERGWVVHATQ
jgi:hypothetical protein